MTIGIMSFISGVLMIAAAIILFVRRRSGATGLFLAGTILTPILPITGVFFSRETITLAFLVASIGPVCVAVGLLWFALSLPKQSVPDTEVQRVST
jgi:hypothetical protein